MKILKTTIQDLSKALNISSATDQIAKDMLRALLILPDTIFRRYAVELQEIKP